MKFCPKCGASCNDSATFCTSCGSSLPAESASANFAQPTQPVVTPGNTFVTSDEYIVSSLSNSAIDNIFSGEGVASEDAICTNKRFYYKKKVGLLNVARRFETVDLDDITGTKVTHVNPIGFLIIAAIIVLLGILLSVAYRAPVVFALIVPALFFVLLYFILKKAFLRIEYAGGFINFSVRRYGLQQILDFQKSIYLAKENLTK